jgi:hypothetical protein
MDWPGHEIGPPRGRRLTVWAMARLRFCLSSIIPLLLHIYSRGWTMDPLAFAVWYNFTPSQL